MRALLLLLFVGISAGCVDRSGDEIRGLTTLALGHEGAQQAAALDKLVAHGRRALPILEAALHTATPEGKKVIISALRRIADVESVPLLGHLAVFDPDPGVRREAEWTLRKWAAGAGPLADRARDQVRSVEERRGAEEAG